MFKSYRNLLYLIFVFISQFSFSQTNFWQEINKGFDGGSIATIAVDSRNNTLYAGTGGGILRSTDSGKSWTLNNSGLNNICVKALAVDSVGNVFAGTGNGVFQSTDRGMHWRHVSNGLTVKPVWCLAITPYDRMFAGTNGGHVTSSESSIFRSTNNGSIWTRLNRGLTNDNVLCFAVNAKGDIFAGADGGIFRSTDKGTNWNRIGQGIKANGILSILVTPIGHLLAGTLGYGIFRSEDNGETWKQVNNGLPETRANVWSFAVDPNGDILAGTNKGRIFRTSNEGDSWIRIDNEFSGYKGEFNDVRSIVINSKGHYFAGTSSGVFHSTNKGVTWSKIGELSWTLAVNSRDDFFTTNTLLKKPVGKERWIQINTKADILSFAVDSEGFMYVGTDGNGVLRSKRSMTK